MRGAAHPLRLRHQVGEAIARHALWSPGDRVAVAVSGGLDSVALLDLLRATVRWHGARLQVVTVDHGIHPASAEHAAFVADLARRHDLSCTVVPLALGADTSEAEARRARYQAFERLEVDRVALAHHRDDQAETVLLHLLRGTGIRGLGAMRPRRGRYVRPLLQIPRQALEAWATHRELTWMQDPTNTDPRYLRNRIRGEVLPLLESLRPGAAAALARTAGHCAELDAWMQEQAEIVGDAQGPWNVAERDKVRG